MLTTGQLIKIFSKSQRKEHIPDTEEISNIMRYVSMESGIAENQIDYYFKINLFDLSKSGIPEETVFEMAENGWVLSKDRKYLYFFY